ncbi:hypothetical protein [Priestia megaterium]|uniref:hypothetical protein n=1 Tax=Priestia megaterium TaxID=1404 RepID=UPI0015CF45A0|nr:hypothetical protein [Priestia megaterium]
MEGKKKPPAGKATRRLSGRPRKAKSCTEINCGVTSGSAHVSHLFIFRWATFSHNLFFFESIILK